MVLLLLICCVKLLLLCSLSTAIVISPFQFLSVCMTSRRVCRKDPDHFCYICREHAFKDCRRNITQLTQTRYKNYFKKKLGDQDKPFAPHILCKGCSDQVMPFAAPMAWWEQSNYYTDCYFSITTCDVEGFKKLQCTSSILICHMRQGHSHMKMKFFQCQAIKH